MSDITQSKAVNPCPKCGDDSASRRAHHGWYTHPAVPTREVEALRVTCMACGAVLGLFHPMDDPVVAGQEVA